jgi:hypothetical protein
LHSGQYVIVDGAGRKIQYATDFFGGIALRDQPQTVFLSLGQSLNLSPLNAHQLNSSKRRILVLAP